jgi:hypothetical protein
MIGAVVFALIGPALQAGFGLAAEEISFQDVWSRVRTEGRTRAASLDLRASTVARERADRHIYPRVYLDARGFNSK